jgi:hypothetical protein
VRAQRRHSTFVTTGLDPVVHVGAGSMDCRIKSGNDE